MKIEVPVYRCDVCEVVGTEQEREDTWFDVGRAGKSTDVCCPDCLTKLGRQIRAEEGKAPAADEEPTRPRRRDVNQPDRRYAHPNDEPCPVCGIVRPTQQGHGAHIYQAHHLVKNGDGTWVPAPAA